MTRSIIGAKVRLIRTVTTVGGTTFHKGVVVRVQASTSHGLTVSCYKRGHYCSISRVERDAVEIIEMPPSPEPKKKQPNPDHYDEGED